MRAAKRGIAPCISQPPKATAEAAIKKAEELIDQGKNNVTILAPDGRAYQQNEFGLLPKGGNS
jgi:hypothetical protein